jgi:hypothetical protein
MQELVIEAGRSALHYWQDLWRYHWHDKLERRSEDEKYFETLFKFREHSKAKFSTEEQKHVEAKVNKLRLVDRFSDKVEFVLMLSLFGSRN